MELGNCHTLQVPIPYVEHRLKSGCVSALWVYYSSGATLIKYEVEGETRLFAECYECEKPVRPQ